MQNTHEGYLNVPYLPTEACKAYLFEDMQSSLISIGQLCDSGCIAIFDKKQVSILMDNRIILQGKRDKATGLWHVNITPTEHAPLQGPNILQHAAMSAIAAETVGERIAFLHACAGAPALSTFKDAITAGFYTTWPELTARRIDKYIDTPEPTIKGHLDQERKNLKSTKPKAKAKAETPYRYDGDDETKEDSFPRIAEERCNQVYFSCAPITGQVYSDQPGQFLCNSTSGMSYIMIAHDYDSNSILAVAMPNRSGKSLSKAYKEIHALLTSRGFRPKYQLLDNEISSTFKDFLKEVGVEYQLTPAGSHRRNRAERAIRTWKNHFIAILCSTDEAFPLKLWDRLLEQAQITLNLLRASRVNPKLSAQAQLHGPFDFNRTPMGPPGTRVLVHELADNRGTWAPHAVLGYYTGPATEHYRCYKVWIQETSSERIANTLVWFPTRVPMPRTSSADAAIKAAQDLIYQLQNPSPASPLSPMAEEHEAALHQLADIFRSVAPQSETTAAAPRVATTLPTAAAPRVTTTNFTYVAGTRNRGQVRREKATALRQSQLPSNPQPIPSTNRFASLADTDEAATTRPPAPPLTVMPTLTSTDPDPVPPSTSDQPPKQKQQHPRSQAAPQPSRLRRPGPHRHSTRSKLWYQQQQVINNIEPNQDGIRVINHVEIDPNAHRDHFVNSVLDPETGASLEFRHLRKGPDKEKWIQANRNEVGRLTDGRIGNNVVGTNTMRFIHVSELPVGRKPTYNRICADFRPQKADPYRIRYTAGGDKIDYPGITTTPGAEMTTVKLQLNSVISTPNARMMCTDVKDFYLNTEMERYEYMWIQVAMLDQEIIDAYELEDLIVNGRVLVEIQKGMYGLPQAGRLAYDKLVAHLKPHGYHPCARTPGLWRHVTRPINFCLVVDDFAVKYVGKQHADHLLAALQEEYKITSDWKAELYCGITLKWDYLNGTVDLSMPGYIKQTLQRFRHQKPYRPEHSPYTWNQPVYGKKTQLAAREDDSPRLDNDGVLRVQQVVGTTLFYSRAVDSTALPAIGSISAEQTEATELTNQKVTRLLDYFATHPDATIRYTRSGMVLYFHSDASYLSERKARSRLGGYFFLSSKPADPDRQPLATDPAPPMNGPIKVNSTIMKNVLASAAEAETGAMFYNCQDALPIRTTLEEMGHPQPPTHVRGDNSTAIGIANNTIKVRRSKAIDMRYFWLQDREAQKHFKYYWDKGEGNRADYYTKHHSVAHHRATRPQHLYIPPS